jgi:hypothetical protein
MNQEPFFEMLTHDNIPEPFQFNPLKHHLNFIREFVGEKITGPDKSGLASLIKEVRHTGTSVMDLYSGQLSVSEICSEVLMFLKSESLDSGKHFYTWTEKTAGAFRIMAISDTSRWTLKYHNNKDRFVHLFPARSSPHSFRVKANTLNSAILYLIVIGRDFITRNDLNRARALLGLSPVKGTVEAEAITEMIEILRDH